MEIDKRERKEKLEKLTSLDYIYIQVMYYRFLDKSVAEITEKLGIANEKTTWARFTKIYSDLDIKGEDKEAELIRDYSPLLLEFIQSEDDLNSWGYVRAKMFNQIKELSSQLEETPPPDQSSSPDSHSFKTDLSQETENGRVQAAEHRPFPWYALGLLILVLCLLGISATIFGRQIFQSFFETDTPTIEAAQSVLPPISTDPAKIQSTNTVQVVNTQTSSTTAMPVNTETTTSTEKPTQTQTLPPTKISTPPSAETSTTSTGPSGDWAARIYLTDDTEMILANNHIIGATLYLETLDWVNFNDLLQAEPPNYVTFVNFNGGGGPARWGFSLRHNDLIVWGSENGANNCILCSAQTIQILPDDTVKEVNLRDFTKKNLSGSWSAKITAADFGVIMVNGVAVAGSSQGYDFDWFDISGLLYQGQDNIVTVSVWNKNGDYSWDAALRRDNTIMWGVSNKGTGQIGEVFFTSVIVDGTGNIVP